MLATSEGWPSLQPRIPATHAKIAPDATPRPCGGLEWLPAAASGNCPLPRPRRSFSRGIITEMQGLPMFHNANQHDILWVENVASSAAKYALHRHMASARQVSNCQLYDPKIPRSNQLWMLQMLLVPL